MCPMDCFSKMTSSSQPGCLLLRLSWAPEAWSASRILTPRDCQSGSIACLSDRNNGESQQRQSTALASCRRVHFNSLADPDDNRCSGAAATESAHLHPAPNRLQPTQCNRTCSEID